VRRNELRQCVRDHAEAGGGEPDVVAGRGERMNHGVPLKSFVGLPPSRSTLKSSKFETNAIRLPAAHNTGSQHESAE
jgi:hypothetical protein